MNTTDIQKLIINQLTEEQYQAAKTAGTLNPNELYFTEDDSGGLPPVSPSDNGKVLTVFNGAWVAAELPIYDGSVT